MNVYDFDDIIYDGDSNADFFKDLFIKYPTLLRYAPDLVKIMNDYRKTNLRFEDLIAKYGGVLHDFIDKHHPDPEAMSKEFWDKHEKQIKPFYKQIQKEDDLIITASPKFQMDEICKRLGIKHYLASEFDLRTGVFGRPCFRERKIEFFREAYPDGVIDDFYTDSLNDEFLFPYAKRVFWVKGNEITQIK